MPTNFSYFGSTSGSGSPRRKSSSRTNSSNASKQGIAPGYKSICDNFTRRIASYRTLCGQTTGPARHSRPSPATLNSFSKWIEKGAVVFKVSPAQVKKWSKTTQTVKSPTSAKNALAKCFGRSVIKAVTSDKSGSFLVACASTANGRPFHFPR